METAEPLTKKELAARWKCSTKTVAREAKRLGVTPTAYTGNWPVWNASAVKRLERLRSRRDRERAGKVYGRG